MKKTTLLLPVIAGAFATVFCTAQPDVPSARPTATRGNDVTAPLHAMRPDYKMPYEPPTIASVKTTLDRIYNYLDTTTPPQFINRSTRQPVTDLTLADSNTVFKQGSFRLNSYEWGVTYAGMLNVGQATGDAKYTNYTKQRLQLLADAYPAMKALYQKNARAGNPLRGFIDPHALDDGGAVTASIIKTIRAGGPATLRPMADQFINYISTKEFRLTDGTLARNRPLPNTLWLDDLFMSVPALAQMGKLTGDAKYYDDAVKQITQFTSRMWNKEKGLYMHGWVQEMDVHPQFHWARANGWALMAMAELLDVLPENHPGRPAVLAQFQAHAKGLAMYQGSEGFWHQLLDRNDSYLETSATAIYAYCVARGINRGWLNAKAYGPMCLLAWNAVTTKVNDQGQVEGTCVGTGMAFDPAFYYYRPVNVFAAHGYGPVLLAGAEIINLLNNYVFEMNDSAVQVKGKK